MKNLYIHIPFCLRKCDYCAFYSETDCPYDLKLRYIERIGKELAESDLSALETVYIGGGTPTLLELPLLEKLLVYIGKNVDLNRVREFSIESNPETVNADKIQLMQDFNVSRFSMGVQSFSARHRATLGRITADAAIENAIAELGRRPFRHFNIDLIYAIPGQTVTDFAADLVRVQEAGCDHFSAYNLTVEEQTVLAGSELVIDENAALDMYETAGLFRPFRRYEISNYALNEKAECRHNRNVWQGDTLLGAGASAASFDGKDRWTQVSDIELFMRGEAPEMDIIAHDQRMMEIFVVNLRTVKGWNRVQWEKKFPDSWDIMLKKAEDAAKLYSGCWFIDQEHILLSEKGLLFWNEISTEFL